MHDTDIDVCAHLSVDYEPVLEVGGPSGSWLCRDCDMEFTPAQWAEGWRDAADNLSRVAARLLIENTRQRIALSAVGILWTGILLGRRSK